MSLPILKQPGEDLLVEIDFAGELVAPIAIESVAVLPRATYGGAALAVVAQAVSGALARVELRGGTAGGSYLVTVAASGPNAAGPVEREAEILVEDLAWIVPDGTTAYLSIAAFVERAGIAETVRLTSELGTGRIDKRPLIAAIEAAQAEADSYLRARYSVPLAVAPPEVAGIVYDLALARLYKTELPANVAQARTDARRLLRDIANGTALLSVDAAGPSTAPSAPVYFEGGDRRFSRDSMSGY
jgi:phage gp36-like protein